MKLDGLWSVEFIVGDDGAPGSAREMGYGVAVIDNGHRMRGGNSAMYWSGSFRRVGDDLRVDYLEAASHTGATVKDPFDPNGADAIKFSLTKLSGFWPQLGARTFEVTGIVDAADKLGGRLTLRFTKRL